MSESKAATVAPYRCLCENSISITNAYFRAFSSTGVKGKEIDQRSFTSGYLALPDETGNIVKIEYYDVNKQSLGCFSPINNGDTIKVDGVMNNFKVLVNGHPQVGGDCPND
jgi:hypothetical protein